MSAAAMSLDSVWNEWSPQDDHISDTLCLSLAATVSASVSSTETPIIMPLLSEACVWSPSGAFPHGSVTENTTIKTENRDAQSRQKSHPTQNPGTSTNVLTSLLSYITLWADNSFMWCCLLISTAFLWRSHSSLIRNAILFVRKFIMTDPVEAYVTLNIWVSASLLFISGSN